MTTNSPSTAAALHYLSQLRSMTLPRATVIRSFSDHQEARFIEHVTFLMGSSSIGGVEPLEGLAWLGATQHAMSPNHCQIVSAIQCVFGTWCTIRSNSRFSLITGMSSGESRSAETIGLGKTFRDRRRCCATILLSLHLTRGVR